MPAGSDVIEKSRFARYARRRSEGDATMGSAVAASRILPAAEPITVAAASIGAVSAAATMFPGGVSGLRGCGRVGAAFLAATSCSPISSSSVRLNALRTCGNRPFSSSLTWCRTLSISTVTLAS